MTVLAPDSRLPDSGQGPPREYWPQLNGVRAVAIMVVVAYHLGYLQGGWIGVDIFFVLSGYLITGILLADGGPAGGLKGFWGRRARRLLPAVGVVLLVLSVYAWVGGPGLVPAQLRATALATLVYGVNWQEITSGQSYFAQYTAPSPFQHMWSLAIEEQYYIIWPLLLSGLLLTARSRQARWHRRVLITVTASLVVISAVWMGVAAHLFGANRAYLGTDTRAWELLLGGLAAMIWRSARGVEHPRLWSALTALGVLGLAAGVTTAGGPPGWVWDGGLVAIAVCSVLVIVGCVRAPRSPVATLLALGPVRWVGVISYSLYLWHWPVIVLMTTDTTGLTGPSLLAVRLAAMLAASCGSYYLVERPLRNADWPGIAGRVHLPAPGLALAGLMIASLVIFAGTVGPAKAQSAEVSMVGLSRPTAQELLGHVDLPPASAAHPYRVWILGDSVMFDGSLGVQAALQSTGEVSVVVNASFPGWGLTTDHQWPADAARIIATYHPQVVMGTWSWDDPEAEATPTAYLQRLEDAMRVMMSPGNGVEAVALLEFPQGGPSTAITDPSARQAAWAKQTGMQDAWDKVARQAVAAFPGHALYLSTEQIFAPAGRYYTWLRTSTGAWVRARKLDNTHFCPFGAAEFGAVVTEDLEMELHLPAMATGWELGAWTHDPRYDDPRGACPDDQPPTGYRGIALPSIRAAD